MDMNLHTEHEGEMSDFHFRCWGADGAVAAVDGVEKEKGIRRKRQFGSASAGDGVEDLPGGGYAQRVEAYTCGV